MMLAALDCDPVLVVEDDRGFWLTRKWPAVLYLYDSWRRDNPSVACLRWPYMTLRFVNAQATYRIDTCDRGIWTGMLMESWGPC